MVVALSLFLVLHFSFGWQVMSGAGEVPGRRTQYVGEMTKCCPYKVSSSLIGLAFKAAEIPDGSFSGSLSSPRT